MGFIPMDSQYNREGIESYQPLVLLGGRTTAPSTVECRDDEEEEEE